MNGFGTVRYRNDCTNWTGTNKLKRLFVSSTPKRTKLNIRNCFVGFCTIKTLLYTLIFSLVCVRSKYVYPQEISAFYKVLSNGACCDLCKKEMKAARHRNDVDNFDLLRIVVGCVRPLRKKVSFFFFWFIC